MSLNLLTAIILQFTLSIAFVTVFFFTYVRHIEERIVNEQIDRALDELLDEPFVSKYNLKTFHLKTPDLSSEDASVVASNADIQRMAFKFLAIIVAICIAIFVAIIIIFKIPLWHMLIMGIVSVGFIAITEVLFLNYFARQYITLDPNMIKKGIVEGIIQYGS